MIDHQKFVADHLPIMNELCEVLAKAELDSEDGEMLLGWIMGLSLGRRQEKMNRDCKGVEMIAVGWQVGAMSAED